MMRKMMLNLPEKPFIRRSPIFTIGWWMVLFALVVGCTTSKQMVYLNNLESSAKDSAFIAGQPDFQSPIQKNDQLWITVGGSNIQDLAVLNSAGGSNSGLGLQQDGKNALGYLVESDGKIKLPYLGQVQAEGLTRLQLEARLTKEFTAYTKNPVVNVRFLNYRFSVLGEVQRPGVFTIGNERITLLEALSMAGDLTVMGKRQSVLVIREINGLRSYDRVNLLDKSLFTSPYYYLRTNDVIYVEPANSRFASRQPATQYFPIMAGALSLVLSFATFVLK